MKKNKLLVLLLSIILALGTTALYACGSGHKHSYDYTCDATKHWQECVCGQVKKNTEESHTFVNKTCETCTQSEFTAGLTFTKIVGEENYTYHVSGYEGTETNVYIPSAICGKVVNGIAHRAFKDCSSMVTVSIPETITYVGDNAFDGCTSLTYYEKNGLNYLGNEWNKNLYLVGSPNKNATSASIEVGCVAIGSNAFADHQKLSAVIIPTTVKCFAKDAFNGCLTAVLSNVNYLGTADDWAQITFSESSANPIYYSKKLYIQGKLLQNLVLSTPVISDFAFFECDSIRTVVFNEGVTHIGVSAFEGCNAYTKTNAEGYTYYFDTINLPSTLVYIGHSAFRYCANINKLVIPANIEYIGVHAFANCIRLGKITYQGKMEEWSKKYIGKDWNYLAKAVQMQCANGSITLEEN